MERTNVVEAIKFANDLMRHRKCEENLSSALVSGNLANILETVSGIQCH